MGKTYRDKKENAINKFEGVFVQKNNDNEGTQDYSIINENQAWKEEGEYYSVLNSTEKRELRLKRKQKNKETKKNNFQNDLYSLPWNHKTVVPTSEYLNNRKFWKINKRSDPDLIKTTQL
jgi:hypothetical protein